MHHIGIYSGTFDPVHVGHVAFADAARRAAGLDRVIFMPEDTPRGKINVTDINARMAQLETALLKSQHEVYRARHSQFTIAETLAELKSQYPDATLSFLIGSDVVPSLAAWPHLDQLIRNHQIIVGMREPHVRQEIERTLRQLDADYLIVTTPHAHVSSRQIRYPNKG
jgi:nicotinate-nucleotide adenylyltransferase